MPPLARDVAKRLVDAVAALQQEHRHKRARVSPDDMLAQVKACDDTFANVTVSQVRRAISAANNRSDSMDVEPAMASTASASASASASSAAAAPSNGFEHRHARLRSAASMVTNPAFSCAVGNLPELIFEPEPQPLFNYLEHLEKRWGFIDGFWTCTATEDREMSRVGLGRRHSV